MNEKEIDRFILKYDEIALLKQRNKVLNKPTFIGVGAGRCGTTSLYNYFNKHSDVYVSPVKEINFFGFRDKGTNKYGMTFNEYLNFFLGVKDEKVIGEISPAYLTLISSASLIKKHLPDAKILITLRNPIERMISQCKHHYSQHQIKDINEYVHKGFEEYYKKPYDAYRFNWFHPVKNLSQSLYYSGVKQFFEFFGSDQICVVLFDELKANSSDILKKLCNFLNIKYQDLNLPKSNQSFDRKGFNSKLKEDVLSQLVDFYARDLIKLEEVINQRCLSWLEKYSYAELFVS